MPCIFVRIFKVHFGAEHAGRRIGDFKRKGDEKNE